MPHFAGLHFSTRLARLLPRYAGAGPGLDGARGPGTVPVCSDRRPVEHRDRGRCRPAPPGRTADSDGAHRDRLSPLAWHWQAPSLRLWPAGLAFKFRVSHGGGVRVAAAVRASVTAIWNREV
jgi:hypothetical protein